MLSRSTLSTCRTTLGRGAAPRILSYSTEASSEAAPAKPKPKRAIPKTAAFDDLIIPKLPSHALGKGGKSTYTPGLQALGDDEFDGMGRFSKMLARRQAQANNQKTDSQKAEEPVRPAVEIVDVKPPTRQPRRANAGAREGQGQGQRQGGRGQGGQRQGQGRAEAQRAGQPKERQQPRNSKKQANTEPARKRAPVKVEKPLPPLEEVLPETVTTKIEKTDLEALFAAPTSPANRVVPMLTSSSDVSTSHAQLLLECGAGEYSRYLPENLASTEGAVLKTLGPVGYAQLTLARRPDAGLNQRKHVVSLVSSMVGAGNHARPDA